MIFCKYWRSFSAGTKREYMLNSKYGGTTDILAMNYGINSIIKIQGFQIFGLGCKLANSTQLGQILKQF